MNSIKRDRLEIMINILELATESTKKTRLLYGVGINHSQLKRYLQMLEELGMIKKSSKSEYIITDKGRIFLELMSKSVIVKY